MILAAFNLPAFWSSKGLVLSGCDEQCVIQVMRCSKCVLITKLKKKCCCVESSPLLLLFFLLLI